MLCRMTILFLNKFAYVIIHLADINLVFIFNMVKQYYFSLTI